MSEYLQSRLDDEADKLGSYTLARERLGLHPELDEDKPIRRKSSVQPKRGYRPTGRHTVEPSGRDVSRMLANAEADRLSPDERREAARKGAELARRALSSPTERAVAAFDEEIAGIDPDYGDRDRRQAELALNARMRIIAESKKQP